MNVMVSVIFCIIRTNRYFVILIFYCTLYIVKFFSRLRVFHIDYQSGKTGHLEVFKMDVNCKVYYKSCENKRTPCRCSKGVMGGKVIISHNVVEF